MNKITVLIVTNHLAVCQSLESYFALHDEIKVIGNANSIEEVLRRINFMQIPQVIIIGMAPSKIDVAMFLDSLKNKSINSRVLVLSTTADNSQNSTNVGSKAISYLCKDFSPPDIVCAIKVLGNSSM